MDVTRQSAPLIGIVDDDEAVRRALGRLVASLGMRSESFASPAEYLDRGHPEETSCLLFDVQLPGMTGFALHARLSRRGLRIPVVFVTGHPNEEARNRARKAEAVALLEKPVDARDLLAALEQAFVRRAGGRRRQSS
jgi:FixJ family two-component response regulator